MNETDIKKAPLIFGENVFGWTIDEQMSFKLLDAFVEAGFYTIDTADSYSRWAPGNKGGESETIIGNWLKKRGNRNSFFIATKVGSDMGEGTCLRRDYIISSVEGSLKRLQTDYIDLYQSHFDDLSTPVDETMDAFEKLIKQGKVKAIGASNLSIDRLKSSEEYAEKNGVSRYETLQPLYNLYDREKFENEYQPFCIEKNISVIPYYSLASGFLSGKYRTEKDLAKSTRGGGVKKYMTVRGFKILKALDEVSGIYNTTPASVALAWLLTRKTIAAPIASATNIEQLNNLIKGVQIKLDNDALETLNTASSY